MFLPLAKPIGTGWTHHDFMRRDNEGATCSAPRGALTQSPRPNNVGLLADNSSYARCILRQRVLLIAAELDLRARVARSLISSGYAIELVSDDKRALALARADNFYGDVGRAS
jgi:hypothetical protein